MSDGRTKLYDLKHLGRSFQLELHTYGSIGPQFVEPKNTFYEIEFLEYIRQTYPNQKTIIEVGAHCGNHILFYASFLNYDTIHGFEPLEESFELLQRNVAKLERVYIYPWGIWSTKTKGAAHRYQDEPGCTAICPDEALENNIDLVTIDSLNLTNVTMIKMDNEGPELHSLIGAGETITRDRPVLFIEISPRGNAEFSPQFDEINGLLTSWGYEKRNQWYDHIMMEFVHV